jgi:hypothetical protein
MRTLPGGLDKFAEGVTNSLVKVVRRALDAVAFSASVRPL